VYITQCTLINTGKEGEGEESWGERRWGMEEGRVKEVD